MNLKTPVIEHTIELREWITAKQAQYIQEPILQSINFKAFADGKGGIDKLDLSGTTRSQHREIECFVISVDGKAESAENILATVLEFHELDYQAIVDAITELRKKK